MHKTTHSYSSVEPRVEPGLVGPTHAWRQIAMQKEAKIYQKRPNYNFLNVAKQMLKSPILSQTHS